MHRESDEVLAKPSPLLNKAPITAGTFLLPSVTGQTIVTWVPEPNGGASHEPPAPYFGKAVPDGDASHPFYSMYTGTGNSKVQGVTVWLPRRLLQDEVVEVVRVSKSGASVFGQIWRHDKAMQRISSDIRRILCRINGYTN